MDKSIVEYFSGHEGYRCGYCNSSDTCFSHGMWAHTLAPIDYQNLIDRGWRRSGKYCYKPTMSVTCCPLYTIRCEAKKFTLTKSQKKVLKKVHKFLATGKKPQPRAHSPTNESDHEMDVSEFSPDVDMQSLKRIRQVKAIKQSDVKEDSTETEASEVSNSDMQSQTCDTASSDPHTSSDPRTPSEPRTSSKSSQSSIPSSSPSPFKSSNFNRPQCRKAKEIRQDMKLKKLLERGLSPEEAAANVASALFAKKRNEPKSLEEYLSDPLPSEPAHKLELRLVPSTLDNPLFCRSFDESYEIYKKYQTTIHKDSPEKCSTKQYTRFLVTSPFQYIEGGSSSRNAYGSFHHQYWLDDKLIAVGVVDILPFCVSSVYFFYDPEYSFLSLGTYAALREIALTRELNTKYQDLQYYYMGYYIHSCIKMRYKGQYFPSFLLCPETNIFQPIEKCRPKLDTSKYHRLEEDSTKEDIDAVVNLKEVLILYDRTKMSFTLYKTLKKETTDEKEVKEYAQFVGRKCYRKMMLYRDS